MDFGKDIANGLSGTIWVTGYTASSDFPVKNAPFPALSGKIDAFVTQLDASGRTLFFSSFLGGNSCDIGNAISADAEGGVYITGHTDSENFPVFNALDGTLSGKVDASIAKINSLDERLVYSTFLGGSSEDSACDIAVDSNGAVYLTGYTYSKDFPVNKFHDESLSRIRDAFLTKIDSSGTALAYSTYLGGNSSDYGKGIAVDRWGSGYITGYTSSNDFPTRNAFSQILSGKDDAFVTKFNATGSTLVYSTYLGGLKGISLTGQKSKIP